MNAEKTGWFSARAESPVREGTYEFVCRGHYSTSRPFRRKFSPHSGLWGHIRYFHSFICERCRWRGLAKEPK